MNVARECTVERMGDDVLLDERSALDRRVTRGSDPLVLGPCSELDARRLDPAPQDMSCDMGKFFVVSLRSTWGLETRAGSTRQRVGCASSDLRLNFSPPPLFRLNSLLLLLLLLRYGLFLANDGKPVASPDRVRACLFRSFFHKQ